MKNLVLFVSLLLGLESVAQNGTIRGKVIDDTGYPMVGANIVVVGQNKGAAADLDGDFSISLAAGVYDLQISFITFKTITLKGVVVKPGEVNALGTLKMEVSTLQLSEVVITEQMVRNTEAAIIAERKNAPVIMDGISAANIKLAGDGTAVEAAKRVTGVSVEDGKYVYIRGLGDRYTKTTLNGLEIPGLDPDKNSLQMDIFPSSLISNIVVGKNFSAELPADFTGGILNVETKSFPEKELLEVGIDFGYNPSMHFNNNYLTYQGGATDFLGFDDGTRALPNRARNNIPTPISGASAAEVNQFVNSFNKQLGADQATSFMDFGASLSYGNQIELKSSKEKESLLEQNPKLGYVFSLSYKSTTRFYDEVVFGEYQRYIDPTVNDMRYATLQTGQLGENNVLIGALGGLAYKHKNNKYRLNLIHLQSGESRAGQFNIINDGEAVGQSGYIAKSNNLEYNQRSLTNIMLNGTHISPTTGWDVDWRAAMTLSNSEDPDIRRTAFTYTPTDTFFSAGAGGNPARIWRYLDESSYSGKVDFKKEFKVFNRKAMWRFGASHVYKSRDYEILFYDVQFFGSQNWASDDPNQVLDPGNIYPNNPNRIYYQSGNPNPNPNAYSSNVHNSGFYVSQEFAPLNRLRSIIGIRGEYFVQRHTGRDQRWAAGDVINGKNLDNDVVLESFDIFPSINLIYSATEDQNLRLTYGRTIARPSFKELSFAQILDPVTNRIFNGSLFQYSDWDGNLVPTLIDNIDLRWEYFLKGSSMLSASLFYKQFADPIELVRIQEQQTSTEYQPRNVGNGMLVGLELEVRYGLGFVGDFMKNWNINANLTFVQSQISMTDREFNSRKEYEKLGETIKNTRNMAGQSPYVINTGLSYANVESGINYGLFYNVKGPTLYIVGAGLFPDIYNEPFHSLNFSFNKKFGKDQRSAVEFKVANLLNDRIETFYQSYNATKQPFSSFNPGMAFSIGYTLSF